MKQTENSYLQIGEISSCHSIATEVKDIKQQGTMLYSTSYT